MPEDHDGAVPRLPQAIEALTNERRTNASPVHFGQDGERCEALRDLGAVFPIDHHGREEDVPHDVLPLLRDERKRDRAGPAQGVDDRCLVGTTESKLVDVANGGDIGGALGAQMQMENVHGREPRATSGGLQEPAAGFTADPAEKVAVRARLV